MLYASLASLAALLDKSCFLGPRFKGLNFLSQAERNAIVEEELASDLATLDSGCGLTANSESDLTMGPLSKKSKKGKLMTLLSDVLGTDAAEGDAVPMDAAEMAHREVANYACSGLSPEQIINYNCHYLATLRTNYHYHYSNITSN